MFNWVVHTRSAQDIQKRCDYLIEQFKKELYPDEEVSEKQLEKKRKLDSQQEEDNTNKD